MPTTGMPTRTWGPFNGRHLTTIIVTIIVGAVLIPSTAWAVDTFSNVAIEDPVSGAQGVGGRQHHQLVAGTVSARPASPTTPVTFSEDLTNTALVRVVGPTAQPINLSALTLSPKSTASGVGDFYLYVGSQPSAQATCALAISYTLFHVPGVQTSPVFVESFPTPLVIARPATGQKTCVYAYIDTSSVWTSTAPGSSAASGRGGCRTPQEFDCLWANSA